jgi:hypothetical protein|tara:strand:- start:260 stop:457 length:198 start_codon:yes stop_codon:yes gene_type:complete
MIRVSLKIVPDAEPNADGRWIDAEVPADAAFFKLRPIAEHHVVAYRKSHDPQYVAEYQFNTSWIE